VFDLVAWIETLPRSGALELTMVSGQAPTQRTNAGVEVAGPAVLDTSEIAELMFASGLWHLLPSEDGDKRSDAESVRGTKLSVFVQRRGENLQVRIGRPGALDLAPVSLAAPRTVQRKPTPVREVRKAAGRNERVPPRWTGFDPPAGIESEPSPEESAARWEKVEKALAKERAAPAESNRPAIQEAIQLDRVVTVEPDFGALLDLARREGASDLHLTTGDLPRIRLVGRLVPVSGQRPLGEGVLENWIDSLTHPAQRRRFAEVGHVDLAVQIKSFGRLRLNVCRHRKGRKVSIRFVEDAPRSLESLGLPEELAKVTLHHQGLGVISGPSGHGKTTTLAALVDLLNANKAVHIITVEDPVEIVHPVKRSVVSQREVGRHTKSFGSALKGALREDPDVIVIGELRDRETVEMALSAAETGHLVLATMSTPNGSRTIDSLIELFPPQDQAQVRTSLAGTLKMVISQRLVPSADGSRRWAAAEMITGNIPLWSLIRDDKLFQLPSLLQRGRNYGMISVEASLKALVAEGKISTDTAREWADDPRAFERSDKAVPLNDPLAAPPQQHADSAESSSKGNGEQSGVRDLVSTIFRRKR
jgi:twitching motility protein PilT